MSNQPLSQIGLTQSTGSPSLVQPLLQPLLQPLQLGSLTLPNRIILAAMHTQYEDKPELLDSWCDFYAARADLGLLITGGISPSDQGRLYPGAAALLSEQELPSHQALCQAVHQAGGRIAMQILHAGRYAKLPEAVSVSDQASRINPVRVRALSSEQVEQLVTDHARAARLAEQAGYDALEIMGSEGYLLCGFMSPWLNQRQDAWGGDIRGRMTLALAIVRAIKMQTALPLIFRLSAADLLPVSNSLAEVQQAMDLLVEAGVDAINLGIGWHESAVPTIAAGTPRLAFAYLAQQLHARVPLIYANRVQSAADAHWLLTHTNASLVSMARPLLADVHWLRKVQRAEPVSHCIACNQACLDRAMQHKAIGCILSPNLNAKPLPRVAVSERQRIAVVGAGPAGISCALTLAQRGHQVSLYECSGRLGGQLALAAMIPTKQDYQQLLRDYQQQLDHWQVRWQLNTTFTVSQAADFDQVVWAVGVQPKRLAIASPEVLDYQQLLALPYDSLPQHIVLIGGGPIAVDLAHYLYGQQDYYRHWGIDGTQAKLITQDAAEMLRPSHRQVTLLQRGEQPVVKKLGRTTGWAHWLSLQRLGLSYHSGLELLRIEPKGVLYKERGATQESEQGGERWLAADMVVLCVGQEPKASPEGWRIGGCLDAQGIDAERAIEQGYRLGLSL